MSSYPLIYTFSVVVVNARFRAQVRGTGRALATLESGEWVCNGVTPGSLSEPGESPAAAYLAFRKTLGEIIEQFAEDSGAIEDFGASAVEFFRETDAEDESAWRTAVEQLRSEGVASGDGIESIPRLPAETPVQVEVVGENTFITQSESISLASPEPPRRAA